MTDVSPAVADVIRKGAALLLAGTGTVLLLRVLFRLAHGVQGIADPELWGLVVVGAVATLWVRKARPIRRAPESSNGSADADHRPMSDAER
jgi:hypothetical protein